MRFTYAEAEEFIRETVQNIGMGYHPDSRFEDYVDDNGKRLFSDDEAEELNMKTNAAFNVLGTEVYDIAMDEMENL